jgi:hypothetical protein
MDTPFKGGDVERQATSGRNPIYSNREDGAGRIIGSRLECAIRSSNCHPSRRAAVMVHVRERYLEPEIAAAFKYSETTGLLLGPPENPENCRLIRGAAELKANILSTEVIRIPAPKSAPFGAIRRQKLATTPRVRISLAPPSCRTGEISWDGRVDPQPQCGAYVRAGMATPGNWRTRGLATAYNVVWKSFG